jgi:uncharacterized membrane protein
MMKARDFILQLDHDRIVGAIKSAERQTSGEIRVFVHRGELQDDALQHAQKKFAKLGMQKTKGRNGVLIFVAPRAQKFAVIGDEGVHAKCGAMFWQQLVDTMRVHFQEQKFTDALVFAIDENAKLLAALFPRQPGDKNELSDEILEE